MMNIQIRDMRQGFFWANNALIDSFLPAIGAFGLAVYMLLCRYASNETGKCEPSIKMIAKKLSTSEPTVRKAIKALKDNALLKVEERAPSKRGAHNRPNLYQLLPVVVNEIDQGGKARLPGVVNQVDPNHTNIESNQTPDNSSELGVPNSTELAENVSTHLSAAPVLNPAEREILRACNDGVVIAHYHNTEAANHLIELGMIERCQCGAKDVLCLKGKCPTHDKPCPDDVKVTELRTALQQSFLPGSNGNQPEMVVAPSPQTPLPAQPAPAALPEVPTFKVGDFVWWNPAVNQGRNLSGSLPSIRAIVSGIGKNIMIYMQGDEPGTLLERKNIRASNLRHRNAPTHLDGLPWEIHAMEAITLNAQVAAARPVKQGKAKKPAIYSDDALFEAIAAFCFKVTDKADFKAIGGRVAKIRLALCDYVLEKLGKEPTAEQAAKVVERVKALPDWYDRACKKCDRPQSPDTFMTWYIKYMQSLNGTAQAEGDAEWFDAPNGRWLRREKGVLYERDHDNQERWNRVER